MYDLKHIWSKGYKKFSQNNEDGLIDYIFSNIGYKNYISYEICSGDGIECNSANLIHKYNFKAYLFDVNTSKISKGQYYYRNNTKVRFINSWITLSNIQELIQNTNTISSEIDLLSFDMDGIDYWILKTILNKDTKLLDPRVIVLEYSDFIGSELSITVPYKDDFNGWAYDSYGGPNYSGASLRAFINLLYDEYAFIFCEEQGFNAFFVKRSELLNQTELKELTDISACFNIPKVKNGINHRWPRVKHLEWINV